MGRVLTEIQVENLRDLYAADQGSLGQDEVRRVTIPDARVDTGATMLSLPKSVIQQLGLEKKSTKRITSTTGPGEADLYGTVRLTIMGRECPTDVMEVPDGVPALVGQIPLEYFDLVIDPCNQKLIGNPAHGGEHVFEMY